MRQAVPDGPGIHRPRPSSWRRAKLFGVTSALLAAGLAGCRSGPGPGLQDLLANAAPDGACRLQVEGDRIVQAAIPLAPHDLPPEVRISADAIAPGGSRTFAGRELRPRGAYYRIEVRYEDRAEETFRSMLLDDNGDVIERTHGVSIARVPVDILTAAMTRARRLERCEIVSNTETEIGWRITARDDAGRRLLLELDLQGAIETVSRVLEATLTVQTVPE